MDIKKLDKVSPFQWRIEPHGAMRTEGMLFASQELIGEMDDKVYEQVSNVASLPGIVGSSMAMPDAHWGYGFCIGGVAAFDPEDGVISAGGVGFDIACGVRTLHTGLCADDIMSMQYEIADALFRGVPAGLGSTSDLHLTPAVLDDALAGGARWAVERGFGRPEDLDSIELAGKVAGADPSEVSPEAKKRQLKEMGTLGSGNHYLEVQKVVAVYDKEAARAFGISEGDIKISIHCGSRGLGHQIGTDYLKLMTRAAGSYGIALPEKELACAPIQSPVGQRYLGAMRSGMNCALANRQILTETVRRVFEGLIPKADIRVLYDVCHNTCQVEEHAIGRQRKKLFVHRKGATRSRGPGAADLPAKYRSIGQPVLIGGTMGTSSYILVGTAESENPAFSSASHGAGRTMSRGQAKKQYRGKEVIGRLASQGILIRSRSPVSVAEEAPGAYKDVTEVIRSVHEARLARMVAKLVPLICIKG